MSRLCSTGNYKFEGTSFADLGSVWTLVALLAVARLHEGPEATCTSARKVNLEPAQLNLVWGVLKAQEVYTCRA